MSLLKDRSQFLKSSIIKEDQQKLIKALEVLESDPQAFDFLEPVDYIGLGLMDYPSIISHPMDIGTVKKKVISSSYGTLQDFYNDFNLIWDNCRSYNIQGSDICKLAAHCEKVFKKQIDKLFKSFPASSTSLNKKQNAEVGLPKNEGLSTNEKTSLTDKIRVLSNENLVSIIKLLMKECPKVVEEINSDKIQIKMDFIDRNTYNKILFYIDSLDD